MSSHTSSIRRRLLIGLSSLAITALLLAGVEALGAESPEVCFDAKTKVSDAFDIWRNAPPPRRDQKRYRHWPVDDATTMQIDNLNAENDPAVRAWWFQWANRCNRLESQGGPCRRRDKGNFLQPRIRRDGGEIRPFFTTFDRANTCTLLQAGYALGDNTASLSERAREQGLSISEDREDFANRAKDNRVIDICPMPLGRLPTNISGIVLDYEVADGRTPAQTSRFLQDYAAFVHAHGKKAVYYGTPLNAPSQRFTGVDTSNVGDIVNAFDKVTLFLWQGAREGDMASSLNAQLDLVRKGLKGKPLDPKRFIVSFELSSASLQDTAKVREEVRTSGIRDVILWRHKAEVGGACKTDVNRRIACIALGQCS